MDDAKGPIVALDAKSSAVPYALLSSGEGLAAALRAMPFDAHVSMPERPLESLPAFLGLGDVHGQAHVSVDWHGSVEAPTVTADAAVDREAGDTSASVLPFDVEATAHYDGAHAEANLKGPTGTASSSTRTRTPTRSRATCSRGSAGRPSRGRHRPRPSSTRCRSAR